MKGITQIKVVNGSDLTVSNRWWRGTFNPLMTHLKTRKHVEFFSMLIIIKKVTNYLHITGS